LHSLPRWTPIPSRGDPTHPIFSTFLSFYFSGGPLPSSSDSFHLFCFFPNLFRSMNDGTPPLVPEPLWVPSSPLSAFCSYLHATFFTLPIQFLICEDSLTNLSGPLSLGEYVRGASLSFCPSKIFFLSMGPPQFLHHLATRRQVLNHPGVLSSSITDHSFHRDLPLLDPPNLRTVTLFTVFFKRAKGLSKVFLLLPLPPPPWFPSSFFYYSSLLSHHNHFRHCHDVLFPPSSPLTDFPAPEELVPFFLHHIGPPPSPCAFFSMFFFPFIFFPPVPPLRRIFFTLALII